jgi:hypothetical protein
VWTIYIDSDIDKQIRVAAVEDDKFYGQYAGEEQLGKGVRRPKYI